MNGTEGTTAGGTEGTTAGTTAGGTVLLAADLDRTLIYSRSAAGGCSSSAARGYSRSAARGYSPLAARGAAELVTVEHYDGVPASFMTAAAAAMLAELAGEHLLVPVTTRTQAQLARVVLPGPAPRYAVAANGGVLLVDGVLDPGWAAGVRARLEAVAPLAEAVAAFRAACDPVSCPAIRSAQDMFCYAVVDRDRLPAEAVEELSAWAVPAGWVTSLQGRKLYLVPRTLTKSAAIAEVAERAGVRIVLAAGDSSLDLDLLQYAYRSVRPGHGELAAAGWREPHVDALDSTGVVAGEQIVAWFAAQLRLLR